MNPFPGIRNFEPEEDYLFFGRDQQIERILKILSDTHFLALIGYSGSGKSSLIKAGIIPNIAKGKLQGSPQEEWDFIYFRPKDYSLLSFATAIQTLPGVQEKEIADTIILELLKQKGGDLKNIYQLLNPDGRKKWLVVVDQFEELFRFRLEMDNEEKAAEIQNFINLVLSGMTNRDLPVYIVLSMRSDFLDNCTEYTGLLEAINKGSYLLPKISKEGIREIIERPIAIGGGTITEDLVEVLLNDVEENPDQLPVLQHALMRTWDYWYKTRKGDEPIDIIHYEAVGTMATALSIHAEEIFHSLPNTRLQKVTERIFKALTDVSQDNKGIRRPVPLDELVQLTQVPRQDVEDVVDEFRAPGRAFLMPSYNVVMTNDTVIDIAHESIMRVWTRLKDWVQEEVKSAELYLRLAKSAELYQQGKTGLWINPDLALAIQWQQEQKPNAAWAARYNPSFDRTINFLEYSKKEAFFEIAQKENKQKKELRKARNTVIVLGSAFIFSILLFVYSFSEGIRAEANERKASENAKMATQSSLQAGQERKEAVLQQKIAMQQQQIAEEEKLISELQKGIAITQQQIAEEQTEEALKQKQRALIASQQAMVAKNEAEILRNEAEARRKEAELQQKQAEEQRVLADLHRESAEKSERNLQRLRLLSVAKTIATEASRLSSRTQGDLPALLALQAYQLNQKNGGFENTPAIFSALSDAANRKTVLPGHKDAVRDISLTTDNKLMVSCSEDGTVKVWQATGGSNYTLLKDLNTGLKKRELRSVCISSDARFVVAGTVDGNLLVWNLTQAKALLKVIRGHTGIVNQIVFSKTKNSFTTAGSDGYIKIWNLQSFQTPVVSYHLSAPVLALAYSEKSNLLACGTAMGTLAFINTSKYSNIPTKYAADTSPIQTLAFAPSGESLITGSSTGRLKIWNVRDMQKKPVELSTQRAAISAIVFSPDQKTFATGSHDNTIRIWTLSALNENPIIIDDNKAGVLDIAYTADGNQLLSAGADKSIRLYQVNQEELALILCNKVKRNLSHEEWKNYIGEDVAYQQTCSSQQ